MLCLPPPAHEIPVLIGGHADVALRRAGALGAGWLGQQSLDELAPDELSRCVAAVRAAAEDADRDSATLRMVLRIVGSSGRADDVAAALPSLSDAGIDEVIVDLSWEDGADRAAEVATLRAAE